MKNDFVNIKHKKTLQIHNNQGNIHQNNNDTNNITEEKERKNLKNSKAIKVIVPRQRYPYCIIWTRLPFISYIIPFIGHTAICTSEGIIHEFAGSYLININHLSFGLMIKYVHCDLTQKQKEQWDNLIEESDSHYARTKHKILKNNCHHHVGYVLEKIQYRNKRKYSTCDIIYLLGQKSVYVNKCDIVKNYIGIVIIIIIVVIVVLCAILI